MNASLCDRNPMRNSNAVESMSPLSSVPISLHRELCDELRQKTQELEVADHKNQRLVAQNQQLRHELQRLVQQVMQTQQVVTQMTADFPSQEVPSQATIALFVEPSTTLPVASPASTAPLPARRQAMRSVQDHSRLPNAIPSAVPNAVPSGITETSIHAISDPLTTRLWNQTNVFTQDLQGWKMAIVLGLIVLSAFGAGFLIMRPFMTRQQVQPLQPLQPQLPKR